MYIEQTLSNGNNVTIKWKAVEGYIYTDNGKKIKASKATGEIVVEVRDKKGKLLEEKSNEYVEDIKSQGGDNKTNCFGTSLAQGEVWIGVNDTKEVKKLILNDGYSMTTSPGAGDVGIYTTYTKDDNINKILDGNRHAVNVNDVSGGVVTNVASKNGIVQFRPNVAPGPGPNTAWDDKTTRIVYFTKRVSGK